MNTVESMLKLASEQVGNYGTRYWNWYTDNIRPGQGWYIDGDRTPYCAEYISWLLAHNETECAFFPSPVAFDFSDTHPSDRISKYSLNLGDVVTYDWNKDLGGDHVGLVIDTFSWGIRANEGNVRGIVQVVDRSFNDILFGLRPKYKDYIVYIYVDGIFGPKTKKVLQTVLRDKGYYDRAIDGDFGYYSNLALQKYLRNKGFYSTSYLLDGDFGYYSTIALQNYLRLLGYYTTDYLIDGDWGKYTTMALQKALNDSRF